MEKKTEDNIVVIAGGKSTDYIASILYKGQKHNTIRLHMRQAYVANGEYLAKQWFAFGLTVVEQKEVKDVNKSKCICGHSDVQHKDGKKCTDCVCKKFIPQSIDVIEIVLEKIPAIKLH